MGLIYSRLKILLDAKTSGADFTTTAMIGRQKLSLSNTENKKIETVYGLNIEKDSFNFDERDYADLFIKKYLDIKELIIFDFSDYEGADIVVDLNYPIKEKLYNNFDTLIDGGSIEHIFNFPVAIQNYMRMVKLGGSIFIFTNANNHCGHGFYQFSPEIFFSVFNESNGFQIKSVTLLEHPYPGAELSQKQVCYSVKNPSDIGRRSVIVNKSPLGIMVHAVKIKNKKIFQNFPIQSDYADLGNENRKKDENKSNMNNYFRLLLKILPTNIINDLRGLRQLHKYKLKNDKNFFNKLK